jgi:DNA-binding helix-hairpin-helix protein with protein kinase domain
MGAFKHGIGGWVFFGSLILGAFLIFGGKQEENRRNASAKVGTARSNYETLRRQWDQEASDQQFTSKKAELERSKREYEGLPALRLSRLRDLEAKKRELQLQAFLDKFEIEDAPIRGVGPTLKSALESHGIETAADISYEKIIAVPGFGPAKTTALMKWRQSCEQKFRFDPTKEIDRAAVAALEREIASLRLDYEKTLTAGVAELNRIRQTVLARREAMRPRFEEAIQQLAQAEADLAAI